MHIPSLTCYLTKQDLIQKATKDRTYLILGGEMNKGTAMFFVLCKCSLEDKQQKQTDLKNSHALP